MGREAAVMTESVLNKVTRFHFNPYLRSLLGASEIAWTSKKIMDEGKSADADLGNCDGKHDGFWEA